MGSTWKDLENYFSTSEGIKHRNGLEAKFRRGYWDAVDDVVKFLRSGGTNAQVMHWLHGDLFSWAFNYALEEIIEPPELPKPWLKRRREILLRDSSLCHYCGLHATTVDHKIPLIAGGDDSDDNLVGCCRKCNSKKGAGDYAKFKQMSDFLQSLKNNMKGGIGENTS